MSESVAGLSLEAPYRALVTGVTVSWGSAVRPASCERDMSALRRAGTGGTAAGTAGAAGEGCMSRALSSFPCGSGPFGRGNETASSTLYGACEREPRTGEAPLERGSGAVCVSLTANSCSKACYVNSFIRRVLTVTEDNKGRNTPNGLQDAWPSVACTCL